MVFDDAFRERLRDLFLWRRDVRRFRTDALPAGAVERLLRLACLAPSVGLSQPWRFVLVDRAARREAVRDVFERCNSQACQGYASARAAQYAALKLAGLREAPVHLAVFADRGTPTGHGLGRHTMPEMIEYSAVAAVHTLWLAARAEGIGLGWVSILDPARIGAILDVPAEWRLIGYFCLGIPLEDAETPELERAGWERRIDLDEVLLRR